MTSVPVGGTGWRDVPLPQPRVGGGLWGVRGSPPSSERVVGRQGGSIGVWGKVGRPHGPGGAGYLGPRRAGPGLGKHVQRERTGCLSLSRPSPGALWAPGYCRGPPSQPPGGLEEHTSWRPEPGSEICLPELTRAAEIRHKIISEQSV